MSSDLLTRATAALGELNDDVIYIGGATVGLWFTDPAAPPPRATVDVDVVAEVTTRLGYARFQGRLRAAGFAEDVASGVICRWRHSETGLILDVVPQDPTLAGFSAGWLPRATSSARWCTLPTGETLRAVAPAWLLVCKLEAFASRGSDDCFASRDFEDVVLLVDSRGELDEEVDALPPDARAYVAEQSERVAALPHFEDAVEGALRDPGSRERVEVVTLPRWRRLGQ